MTTIPLRPRVSMRYLTTAQIRTTQTSQGKVIFDVERPNPGRGISSFESLAQLENKLPSTDRQGYSVT